MGQILTHTRAVLTGVAENRSQGCYSYVRPKKSPKNFGDVKNRLTIFHVVKIFSKFQILEIPKFDKIKFPKIKILEKSKFWLLKSKF